MVSNSPKLKLGQPFSDFGVTAATDHYRRKIRVLVNTETAPFL